MSFLEQGDIIEVDFNPSVGHEPAKPRPAIVVTGHPLQLTIISRGVVPVQTTDTGYPLHVPVTEEGLHGVACVEMVRTIDVEYRGFRIIGVASDGTMRKIMGIIRGMFDLR